VQSEIFSGKELVLKKAHGRVYELKYKKQKFLNFLKPQHLPDNVANRLLLGVFQLSGYG
jgi:hypothetical protein